MTDVRVVTLVMIGMILCAGPTWAASKANKAQNKAHEGAQQRSCLLPNPWRVLKVSAHLSPEQKVYLPELCRLVQSEFAISLTDDPSLPHLDRVGDLTEAELTVQEDLYSRAQGHLENLAWLLEQAFSNKPFNQKTFWRAWQKERQQYFEARAQLLRRQVDRPRPRRETAKNTPESLSVEP